MQAKEMVKRNTYDKQLAYLKTFIQTRYDWIARGVEDEKADHPARETGGNHKILEKLDLGPKQDAEEEKQRQESECDQ